MPWLLAAIEGAAGTAATAVGSGLSTVGGALTEAAPTVSTALPAAGGQVAGLGSGLSGLGDVATAAGSGSGGGLLDSLKALPGKLMSMPTKDAQAAAAMPGPPPFAPVGPGPPGTPPAGIGTLGANSSPSPEHLQYLAALLRNLTPGGSNANPR